MSDKFEKKELLQSLLDQASSLVNRDSRALDATLRRVEMVTRRIFGTDSKYLDDLQRIHFSPMFAPATAEYRRSSWESGCNQLVNLIKTMQEELDLFDTEVSIQKELKESVLRQVFVVHGHDQTMKAEVARTIENLDLEAVILHEKPNLGRTIIEKFDVYSRVGFAVILLSPDDEGRSLGGSDDFKTRARQNVIFELGFFLGRLGRDRVLALYKKEENFEMPSDYSGVLFVPYDASGNWQFQLIRELKAAGYDVDANKLLYGK